MKPLLKLVLMNAAIQFFTTTAFIRLEFFNNEKAIEALCHPYFLIPTLVSIFGGSILRLLDLGRRMANIVLKWHKREKYDILMKKSRSIVYVGTDLILILMSIFRVIVYRYMEHGIEYSMGINLLVFLLHLTVYVIFEPFFAFLFICVKKRTD